MTRIETVAQNLLLINDYFKTISGHFFGSMKGDPDGHFEGLKVSVPQLDQELWHKTLKFPSRFLPIL